MPPGHGIESSFMPFCTQFASIKQLLWCPGSLGKAYYLLPLPRPSHKIILKNSPALGFPFPVLAHGLLTDDDGNDNPLSLPSLSVGSDITLGRRPSQQLPTAHPSRTASPPPHLCSHASSFFTHNLLQDKPGPTSPSGPGSASDMDCV